LKINNYTIEKTLSETKMVVTYLVRDEAGNPFIIRGLKSHSRSENTINSWFQIYEEYQLQVTNFNYLPKLIAVNSDQDGAYALFPYEKGVFLTKLNQLTLNQIEQLLEAVRHLHKKGIIHGNIHEDNIWLREKESLLLFGAGEEKVVSQTANYSKQSDLKQILSLLKRCTPYDWDKLDGQPALSLEDIHNHLKTVMVKPGLVEREVVKESKFYSVPERDSGFNENVPEPVKKTIKKKNSVRGWIIGFAAVFVLLFVGIGGYYLGNSNGEVHVNSLENPKVETLSDKVEETQDTEPPSISAQQVSMLYPGWQDIKQETIKIKNSYYTVLALGQKKAEDTGKSKIVVIDYLSSTNEWEKIWESEEFDSDPYLEVTSFIGDFLVLTPEEQEKALLVFNIMNSGNSGNYEVFAVEIDQEGHGEMSWQGNGFNIKETSSHITVYDLGETSLSMDNNEVTVATIPRSEVAPANALKLGFTLDKQSGYIVPTGERVIQAKLGDLISFLPGNSETKDKFDKGEISIHANLNSTIVPTDHASLYHRGNAFELTEEGTYQFLLYDYNANNVVDDLVTFVVKVGDIKLNSDSKLEAEFEKIDRNTLQSTLVNSLGQPDFTDGVPNVLYEWRADTVNLQVIFDDDNKVYWKTLEHQNGTRIDVDLNQVGKYDFTIDNTDEVIKLVKVAMDTGKLGPFSVDLIDKDFSNVRNQFGEPDEIYNPCTGDCGSPTVAYYGDYQVDLGNDTVWDIWIGTELTVSEFIQIFGEPDRIMNEMYDEMFFEKGNYPIVINYDANDGEKIYSISVTNR
jgi:serine/threonine protein kinase